MRPTVMFSSWPLSALVAGEKIGGSIRSLFLQARGHLLAGQRAALRIFPATPTRRDSRGSRIRSGTAVPRLHSMARPATAARWGLSAGTAATISSASAEIMWCLSAPASLAEPPGADLRQHRAFIGIGSAITTS